MIQAIELRDSRVRIRVVLPEVGFRLALFVTALNEIVPLFQIGKGFCLGAGSRCAHGLLSEGCRNVSVLL